MKNIIIIGLIIAFFVPVTVNYNFIASTMTKTYDDAGFLTKVAMGVNIAFSSTDEFNRMFTMADTSQIKDQIQREFKNYEEKNGFQKSYKYQLLKSKKYKPVEKPGMLSGLKNGFIAVYYPILNIIKAPFVVIKMIIDGRAGQIVGHLFYTFISIFTCALSLFFMKGSILYYVTFILGLFLGIGSLGAAVEE